MDIESPRKTREELLKFFKGLEKKHGRDGGGLELVLKVDTENGKVKRRNGHFLGLREDREVGLRNDAKGSDAWFALERIHDAWKRGQGESA